MQQTPESQRLGTGANMRLSLTPRATVPGSPSGSPPAAAPSPRALPPLRLFHCPQAPRGGLHWAVDGHQEPTACQASPSLLPSPLGERLPVETPGTLPSCLPHPSASRELPHWLVSLEAFRTIGHGLGSTEDGFSTSHLDRFPGHETGTGTETHPDDTERNWLGFQCSRLPPCTGWAEGLPPPPRGPG